MLNISGSNISRVWTFVVRGWGLTLSRMRWCQCGTKKLLRLLLELLAYLCCRCQVDRRHCFRKQICRLQRTKTPGCRSMRRMTCEEDTCMNCILLTVWLSPQETLETWLPGTYYELRFFWDGHAFEASGFQLLMQVRGFKVVFLHLWTFSQLAGMRRDEPRSFGIHLLIWERRDDAQVDLSRVVRATIKCHAQ